ncbi:MAG: hypothetical protein AB1486_03035 [Planctomycetota bacterium]
MAVMIRRLLKRLRGVIRPPWFIRVVSGQREDWEDVRGKADELAGAAFSKVEEAVSAFKVYGPVEEARAVAAWHLNRKETPAKAVLAIRFTGRELRVAGIKARVTKGQTGVASADQAHRDLAGGRDQFTRLTELVLARQRGGWDRVRRIGWKCVLDQLRALLDDRDEKLSDEARDRCQDLVVKLEKRHPGH